MPQMGRYCKAYPAGSLRQFAEWAEKTDNLRKETTTVDGKEIQKPRDLADGDYLYLQENFTVTDGIYLDEMIVFDDVTPQWVQFCTETLKFEPTGGAPPGGAGVASEQAI